MKSYLLGIYEKAMPIDYSMEEKLTMAKAFGYDFMELSIDESEEKLARLTMSSLDRAHLRELCAKIDLPIRTLCLSGHRKYPLGSTDPALRKRSLEIAQQAIQLACDLGIRIIQLAGYDVYYEASTPETKQLFLENLRKITAMAAQAGVVLAFETMETPFLDTVWKAMEYVQTIHSPYLQIYPDIGNCTNAAHIYGTDVLLDLRSGKGHLAAMHLKETIPGSYREIKYGTGHVDFTAAIKAAQQMGVGIFVTEFWDQPTLDAREHIAYSHAFIEEQFSLAASQALSCSCKKVPKEHA